MSMQELLQAFGMFKQSVQEASTANAISDATEAMQQIKSNVTDEAQKRQALQGLSDQVALRLTGIGAPASAVQQAFQSIAPQQFGSVEQMQLEGALSGNQQYQKTASGILGQREQAIKSRAEFENKLAMERDNAKFQKDLIVAQMQASKMKPEDIALSTAKMYGMQKTDPNLAFSNKEEMVKFREGTYKAGQAATLIKSIEDMVAEHGTESWSMGSASKVMNEKFGNLILQLKELKNLGVLQKIDVDTLEKVVPNPTSLMRTSTWQDQMSAFKQQLADDLDLSAKMRGYSIDDKFAEQLGLGRQLGALPQQVKGQMPPELVKRFELAKKWRHTDPKAAADYEGMLRQVYGK